MQKKINILGKKTITFSLLILIIFGSLMIASAEMGNSVGNTDYLKSIIIKQALYTFVGIVAYLVCMNINFLKYSRIIFYIVYTIILGALIACRAFGQTNGAYAWIWLGSVATIQPSEFAKVFMIILGARLLGKDRGQENENNFKLYAILTLIYAFVVIEVQNDLGSGVVLLAICYCVALIPPYKELAKVQKIMVIIIFAALGFVALLLSPFVTEWMKSHADNYMVGRFLAAADPFLYRYDNGYHVIMALVSFANGNIFGLGYGNSIHKYMNFPNPSNDFILPVIVEELGIVGFVGFVIAYCFLLLPLVRWSIKTKFVSSKMILLGVFTYFVVHFILNVGGVSAIIPLTGVPLLTISSGGSSLVASMAGLGIAQYELIRNRKYSDESNSRQI